MEQDMTIASGVRSEEYDEYVPTYDKNIPVVVLTEEDFWKNVVGHVCDYLDNTSLYSYFCTSKKIREFLTQHMKNTLISKLEKEQDPKKRFRELLYKFNTVALFAASDECFKGFDPRLIVGIRFKCMNDRVLMLKWFKKFMIYGRQHADPKFRNYTECVDELLRGKWTKDTNHYAVDYPLTTAWMCVLMHDPTNPDCPDYLKMLKDILTFASRGRVTWFNKLDDRVPEKELLTKLLADTMSKKGIRVSDIVNSLGFAEEQERLASSIGTDPESDDMQEEDQTEEDQAEMSD